MRMQVIQVCRTQERRNAPIVAPPHPHAWTGCSQRTCSWTAWRPPGATRLCWQIALTTLRPRPGTLLGPELVQYRAHETLDRFKVLSPVLATASHAAECPLADLFVCLIGGQGGRRTTRWPLVKWPSPVRPPTHPSRDPGSRCRCLRPFSRIQQTRCGTRHLPAGRRLSMLQSRRVTWRSAHRVAAAAAAGGGGSPELKAVVFDCDGARRTQPVQLLQCTRRLRLCQPLHVAPSCCASKVSRFSHSGLYSMRVATQANQNVCCLGSSYSALERN